MVYRHQGLRLVRRRDESRTCDYLLACYWLLLLQLLEFEMP